jgi:glycosyltransferase involved in cell wall biosynthesis
MTYNFKFYYEFSTLIIGFMGLWRHGAYVILKLIPSCFYKPKVVDTSKEIIDPSKEITIICPAYKPEEKDFEEAIETWVKNDPYEIIFLPDKSNIERCKKIIEEYKGKQKMRVLTGYNPNKRNAMYHGYLNCDTNYLCFVDDDVLFCNTLLKEISIGFQDKDVCGIAPRQVAESKTDTWDLWDCFNDIKLFQRFTEIRASNFVEASSACISGRCAIYRKSFLDGIPDFKEGFTRETFFGKYLSSGDDKRLTRYLINSDKKMWSQISLKCTVKTKFEKGKTNFKQMLRWGRNSWRSDLRLVLIDRKIICKYPYLTILLIDRLCSPFAMLIGLIFIFILFFRDLNLFVLLYSILYIFLTRSLKLIRYFLAERESGVSRPLIWIIKYVPIYIVLEYFTAFMKIYALLTLHNTGWGSRSILSDENPEFLVFYNYERKVEPKIKEITLTIDN